MSCLPGQPAPDPPVSHRKVVSIMAAAQHIVGGVDPHAETIHVAVLTAVGKVVGDAEFPTTAGGYRRARRLLAGLSWRRCSAVVVVAR